MVLQEREGRAAFQPSGTTIECTTWYKVFGDLASPRVPVIMLHGGPGGTHEYLLNHTLLTERHGIPTIYYDALGNGRSTRLRDRKGDVSFWTEELFRNELDFLVDHLGLRARGFHLVGHSWGGMLATAYASYKPAGLKSVVNLSTPADMGLWQKAQSFLRSQMPTDVQETLTKCEQNGTTESKEYEETMKKFYQKHLCKLDPWPETLLTTMGSLVEDSTVYGTMNGPSETYITGTIKTWQVTDRLDTVDVPVLLVNGEDDEARDECVMPFFRKLRKVRWVTIAGASHMSHFEKPEKHFEILSGFLLDQEG